MYFHSTWYMACDYEQNNANHTSNCRNRRLPVSAHRSAGICAYVGRYNYADDKQEKAK